MKNDNDPECDSAQGNQPHEPLGISPQDAQDEDTSQLKREAAAARIYAIIDAGQQRLNERFRAHIENHGDEYVTSAKDFLSETSGNEASE